MKSNCILVRNATMLMALDNRILLGNLDPIPYALDSRNLDYILELCSLRMCNKNQLGNLALITYAPGNMSPRCIPLRSVVMYSMIQQDSLDLMLRVLGSMSPMYKSYCSKVTYSMNQQDSPGLTLSGLDSKSRKDMQ
jgi:hypothetical protein